MASPTMVKDAAIKANP